MSRANEQGCRIYYGVVAAGLPRRSSSFVTMDVALVQVTRASRCGLNNVGSAHETTLT